MKLLTRAPLTLSLNVISISPSPFVADVDTIGIKVSTAILTLLLVIFWLLPSLTPELIRMYFVILLLVSVAITAVASVSSLAVNVAVQTISSVLANAPKVPFVTVNVSLGNSVIG